MISTRGRYALRVMVDLASQDPEEFIPLKEIAERQKISLKYLEAVLKRLVKDGFLYGQSGRGGGYKLSRRPSEITVGEIVECAEGTLAPVACLQADAPACPRREHCRTIPLWENLNSIIRDYLYSITLDTL